MADKRPRIPTELADRLEIRRTYSRENFEAHVRTLLEEAAPYTVEPQPGKKGRWQVRDSENILATGLMHKAAINHAERLDIAANILTLTMKLMDSMEAEGDPLYQAVFELDSDAGAIYDALADRHGGVR